MNRPAGTTTISGQFGQSLKGCVFASVGAGVAGLAATEACGFAAGTVVGGADADGTEAGGTEAGGTGGDDTTGDGGAGDGEAGAGGETVPGAVVSTCLPEAADVPGELAGGLVGGALATFPGGVPGWLLGVDALGVGALGTGPLGGDGAGAGTLSV